MNDDLDRKAGSNSAPDVVATAGEIAARAVAVAAAKTVVDSPCGELIGMHWGAQPC